MLGTYISPAESGFYYLESRYYDPQIERFINADGYVSTGQGVASYNLLLIYEGFFPTPYDDGYGNITIGYGHLIKSGESFTSITEKEALNLLAQDLNRFENSVNLLWMI